MTPDLFGLMTGQDRKEEEGRQRGRLPSAGLCKALAWGILEVKMKVITDQLGKIGGAASQFQKGFEITGLNIQYRRNLQEWDLLGS